MDRDKSKFLGCICCAQSHILRLRAYQFMNADFWDEPLCTVSLIAGDLPLRKRIGLLWDILWWGETTITELEVPLIALQEAVATLEIEEYN